MSSLLTRFEAPDRDGKELCVLMAFCKLNMFYELDVTMTFDASLGFAALFDMLLLGKPDAEAVAVLFFIFNNSIFS